ncbi:MAG: AEC family transporter [Ardenticatenaceae bacterium]
MILQLFSIFIDVVTPVFALVLIGYFAGPRLDLQARTLSRVAYFIFAPAFIFDIISRADVPFSAALQMTGYSFVVHLACAAVGFGVAKLLGRSSEMAGAYVLIAVFGNVGNFGLSMIDFRLGEEALVIGTIYFLAILVIAFIISVAAASWIRGSGGIGALLSVFKTPALLALWPALLFVATPLDVPLVASRITSLLGSAMIPLMLVTLGVQLGEVGKFEINLDVVMASSVRLLVAPILATILVVPFGLVGFERDVGILQASMPAAVLCTIIAMEYDLVPEFVTTTVLFSTIASLLTLTVVLSIV